MFKFIKIIFFLSLIVAVGAIYFFYQALNTANGGRTDDILFTVKAGEGVNQISQHLFDQKLIKSKFVFETYVWLKKSENRLMAGEHQLNGQMTIKKVFETLKSGDSVDNERVITIIEGWRAQEMADYLADRGFGDSADFMKTLAIVNWRKKYEFLTDVKINNVEGFLFPDTYRVFAHATLTDIVKKMLDNFNAKLTPDMRQEIIKQKKTVFEVITLASIVEREALTAVDKKMVAGIFLNRLENKMALQSDATVNYITNKGMRRPLLTDLVIDSPYNTYKYRGLPPGPISNPGLDAITAVIYPTASDYLYFLMDESGKAYYAKTYDGHLENIRKYLN